MKFDPEQLALSAETFLPVSGGLTELRIPGAEGRSNRTDSGYFKDRTKLIAAATRYSGRAPGVYFLPNAFPAALFARSPDSMREYARATTSDTDISRRLWFLLDFDAMRPAEVSSTNGEHEAALYVAKSARGVLSDLGFPDGIYADSGNGAHLLYRIDLPADLEHKAIIQKATAGAGELFTQKIGEHAINVDQKTFNESRIWKLYGTLAAKGANLPEWPHRLARILDLPSELKLAPLHALIRLGAHAPILQAAQGQRGVSEAGIDLRAWIEARGGILPDVREKRSSTFTLLYTFPTCPFNESHTRNEAFVGQLPSGAISASCQHNSCTWGWKELRERFEPGCYAPRAERVELPAGLDDLAGYREAKEKETKEAKSDTEDDPQVSTPTGERFELVRRLNEKHFVLRVSGKTVVASHFFDKAVTPPRWTIEFSSFGDFKNYHLNQWIKMGEDRKTDVGTFWLKHKERRTYERLVFLPGDQACPAGVFNLWQGFAVKPAKGDCSRYWAHLRDVICKGDDELTLYARRWMAHSIQKTEELPRTALVLVGLQGTGKGMFVQYYGRLFGQHFLTVNSMEHVSGRFNAHMKDCVVLNANEAVWGGNKQQEGNLKALITDDMVAIEHKGKDLFTVPNYKRVLISTNSNFAVPMDMDDRRFVVLPVSDERKEDVAYFKALKQQMENGGLPALMWDLMHEDIEDWLPYPVPRSGSFSIKIRSAPSTVQWIYSMLRNGTGINDNGDLSDFWNEQPMLAHVQMAYIKWCFDHQKKHPATQVELEEALFSALPGLGVRRTRPWGTGTRPWRMRLGSLEKCRTAFERGAKETNRIWDEDLDDNPPF